MDELKRMIKECYNRLQGLEGFQPTRDNVKTMNDTLDVLDACYTVISKAKVIDNEEKEEPEDGNNDNEPGSDETCRE